MQRWMAVAALLAALLGVALPAVAKPPSFAVWHAHWKARSDAKVNTAKVSCALPNSSDAELGECVAKALLATYPPLIAQWNRQVTDIARGQTDACRAAIHSYRAATSKNYAETLAFFRAHRHASLTAIATDARAARFQALGLGTAQTASRAGRICG